MSETDELTATVAQQYGKFLDLFDSALGKEVLGLLKDEYDSSSVWSDNPTTLALQAGAQSVVKEIEAKMETARKLKSGNYVAVSTPTGISIVKKTEAQNGGTNSTRPELAF